ncbi:hypothetical protein K6664_10420 [Escherichia ruysiae]|uniref:hypothetical protein n=1 Tax=Escherichia TaxID=561 RepID=UPI000CF79CC1|nr:MULTISPECIES: hypothetical protein [Escherichia]MBS5154500.1 hypothetical protein [Escherichia coli]MBY7187215.1 hypothetical protein [Escherichia ruysiae]MBY7307813.1 hypothetical protein [Escherichia ruysiae]MBY7367020.1 hypothetical protein [Escherichia coli]
MINVRVSLLMLCLFWGGGALAEECQITTTQPTAAFGKVNRQFRSDLTGNGVAANGIILAEKISIISIHCSEPQYIRLFFHGATKSLNGQNYFAFGNTSGVRIVAKEATADTNAVNLALVTSGASSALGAGSNQQTLRPEAGIAFVHQGGEKPIENATVQLVMQPVIAGADLNPKQQTTLVSDLHVTLEKRSLP